MSAEILIFTILPSMQKKLGRPLKIRIKISSITWHLSFALGLSCRPIQEMQQRIGQSCKAVWRFPELIAHFGAALGLATFLSPGNSTCQSTFAESISRRCIWVMPTMHTTWLTTVLVAASKNVHPCPQWVSVLIVVLLSSLPMSTTAATASL